MAISTPIDYTRNLKLDINPSAAPPVIRVKQGDASSRFIAVTLTKDGEIYSPNSGITYLFRCEKPDGTAVLEDSSSVSETYGRKLVTISGDNVVIELVSQVCVVAGRCRCDLCLMSGDRILSTIPFIIEVVKSPDIGNQAVSSNEFEMLMNAIRESASIIDEATSATAAANSAATNANNKATAANNAASIANTAADTANNMALSAMDAADKANVAAQTATEASALADDATSSANDATTEAMNAANSAWEAVDLVNKGSKDLEVTMAKVDNMTASAHWENNAAQPNVTMTQDEETGGYNLDFGLPTGNSVVSVAGKAGAVILDADDVSGVVHDDGDEMTGDLVINRSENTETGLVLRDSRSATALDARLSANNGDLEINVSGAVNLNKDLVLRDGNIYVDTDQFTLGTTPSEDIFPLNRIYFRDAAGNHVGQIYHHYLSDGRAGILIEAKRSINGSNAYNSIFLSVDDSGNQIVSLSNGGVPFRQALGLGTNGALPITIGQGGTGATTRLNAFKNLANESVGADVTHLITIKSDWSKCGYSTLQQVRNAMGLGNTTGALPVANGGTGLTAAPSVLVNLASTTAVSIMAAAPRPGITGTLGVAHGGTGLTAAPSMLTNLGSTTAASIFAASPRPGITGTLALEHGGTGATTRLAAFKAINNANVGANVTHLVTLKSDWSQGGYSSLQQVRNAMGLGNTTGALPIANGGTGQTGTNKLATIKSIITAYDVSGNATASKNYTVTITSAVVARYGQVISLFIKWKKSTAISVPANGNIADFTIGTLIAAYRPAYNSFAVGVSSYGLHYSVNTDGTINVTSGIGNGTARDIPANTELQLRATYVIQ